MPPVESVLFVLALLAYILSSIGHLAGEDRADGALYQLRRGPLWLGFSAHIGGVITLGVRLQDLPVRSPGGSLATLAGVVALGFVWTRCNPRAEAVGSFVVPLIVVLAGLALVDVEHRLVSTFTIGPS